MTAKNPTTQNRRKSRKNHVIMRGGIEERANGLVPRRGKPEKRQCHCHAEFSLTLWLLGSVGYTVF